MKNFKNCKSNFFFCGYSLKSSSFLISTHSKGFERELKDLICHHSLLSVHMLKENPFGSVVMCQTCNLVASGVCLTGKLVLLGFNATLTAKIISLCSWRTCVSWLSHNSTNTTFLSKATDYFSHMLLQKWKMKIHRKKVHLHQRSNSQPSGHESDTLTIEPPRPLGKVCFPWKNPWTRHFTYQSKFQANVKVFFFS